MTTLLAMIEAGDKDSFLLFAVAKEYEKANDDANARSWYEQLRAHDPAYVGLYYHLGKLLERQEETEQALEVYAAGMEQARQQGDQHALGELAGAKMLLED